MKKFFTSLLLISFISAQCQLSIKAGPNMSWFASGDPELSGTRLATVGFAGGLSDKIHLNKNLSIVADLLYLHQGSKTPDVNNRTFSTYSVSLPISLSYKIGFLSLIGGGYIDRLVYARNYDFTGDVYGWPVNNWKYWRHWDYGLTAGLEIDFIGASLDLRYKRGLRTVKGPERPDTRYDGCVNSGVSAMLSLPLNTFQ